MSLQELKRKVRSLQSQLERHRNSLHQTQTNRPQLRLREWCEHYLSEHFYRGWSDFHLELIDRLEAISTQRNQRDRIIAPRGAGKSHITAFAYPLYQLLEQREKYILIASDTYTQACGRIKDLQLELSMNEALQADYGELCQPGPTWRQDFMEMRSGAVVRAVGQGSAARGIKRGKERPTLFIGDDPEGEKHITSAAEREKSWRWLTKTIMRVGQPGTNFLIIGTALHPDCMVMRCQNAAGWNCKTYSAVRSMPTNMDLWYEWKGTYNNFAMSKDEREERSREFYESHRGDMDAGADVFWDNYTLYELMQAWAEDLGSFNTELQGIPYDPSMAYFAPEYLEGDDIWFTDWPKAEDTVLKLVSLDPSIGGSKDSDYQAIVTWMIDKNGLEYIDAKLLRVDIPGMCREVVTECRWFKPHELVLESVGFQRLLGPDIESEVIAQKLVMLNIYAVTGGFAMWDKDIKIQSLSSPLHRRRIRFRRNSPGVALLMGQLREYPFGSHDDGPDALSLCRFRAGEILGDV